MSSSRSKNAVLNILFGYISQIGIIILTFIGRKIFLHFLSVEYLGVNGLYSNILTVLSLVELGLDNAVLFSLYKPVSENNQPLISSMLHYFKKIYIFLAFIITAIGLMLLPFLKYIIDSDLNQNELNGYYILFLINTVMSYFVAHKVALLSAYQELRIQKITMLTVNFIQQILYILVLVFWKNYMIYIIMTIVGTLINNFILTLLCNRYHPFLKNKSEIVEFDKKEILKNVWSTLLYKLGAVAINNTDNILISVIVGITAVGKYSNYLMIVNAIQGFISVVTTSLISGIGNLGTTGNKKQQLKIFEVSLLVYHFIAIVGSICFYLLLNDLIPFWLGSQYLLGRDVVFAIALNFYVITAVSPVWMYREANGLFSKVKYLMLITAALNIILSIVFGKLWGIFGILIASSVSRLLTGIWYEPQILYRYVFNNSANSYYKKQGKYFILSVFSFVLCCLATSNFWQKSLLFMIIKIIIILLICGLIFFVFCFASNEVKELKNKVGITIKNKSKF
ncbi:lipopolysaccharide biosynthesis protein [Scatolibacter rhodanostii]|uniref:lipopolysaccharide biosynthesis protein n=1 Tax=Scatolibacter rhodanostii TaxID=2014781 RepID=UPI000C068713|nr:oligosaccharide flippase family protein [Scatolibacter rhodanostii]